MHKRSNDGPEWAGGPLLPERAEVRPMDAHLAFSVTAYGPTLEGHRELQFYAITMDQATRRTVLHDLGTQPYGCAHNTCAVIDLGERAVEWMVERYGPAHLADKVWTLSPVDDPLA